jgi:putative membrane protein
VKVSRITIAAFGAAALLMAPAVAAAVPAQDSAVSAQDRMFLVAAHQSNLAEIASGEVAQDKATNDAVRQHGAIFIRDHTRLDASLTEVADQLGVDLPSEANAEQQKTLAEVSAKNGAAFDEAWVSTQITAHQKSKANGAKEIADGTNSDVIGLAKTAAPVIESHLAMLESKGTGHSVHAGLGGAVDSAPVLPWALVVTGAGLIGVGAVAARRRRSPTA